VIAMTLKLSPVVVLYIMSKPIDFGFKSLRIRVTGSTFWNFGTSCHLL